MGKGDMALIQSAQHCHFGTPYLSTNYVSFDEMSVVARLFYDLRELLPAFQFLL